MTYYKGDDWTFLESHDFVVPVENCLDFERNGHVVTRGVFTQRELNMLRSAVIGGARATNMDSAL